MRSGKNRSRKRRERLAKKFNRGSIDEVGGDLN